MIYNQVDEVIKNFLIQNRYQNNLELMKGSEFLFDYVQLL